MTPSPAPANWQEARVRILERGMLELEGRLGRGEQLLPAVRRISSRLHGRHVTGRSGKTISARPRTLLRFWYRWRITRLPETLELDYRPPDLATTERFRTWFCRRCIAATGPISETAAAVAAEWKRGEQIPGLRPCQGSDRFPVSITALRRVVSVRDLQRVRRLRATANWATLKAEQLAAEMIQRAASLGRHS